MGWTYSWSLKSEYSSSPILIGLPPNYCSCQNASLAALVIRVISVERTCGIRTLSPLCTLIGRRLPFLSNRPGPTANTFASLSSFTALSGSKTPPAVFVSAFMRCTSTRSRRGATERMDLRMVDCHMVVSIKMASRRNDNVPF